MSDHPGTADTPCGEQLDPALGATAALAKHTPGPWTYWHDECSECERAGEKEFVIDGPPGAQHGQFSHEPDARLISAAPDMLAVLQEMFCDGPVDVAFAGNPTAIADLEARVRAAIAKAAP
jgi:hypothetical protein